MFFFGCFFRILSIVFLIVCFLFCYRLFWRRRECFYCWKERRSYLWDEVGYLILRFEFFFDILKLFIFTLVVCCSWNVIRYCLMFFFLITFGRCLGFDVFICFLLVRKSYFLVVVFNGCCITIYYVWLEIVICFWIKGIKYILWDIYD